MTIHQILTKYWGYTKFRPLQEEIINSVLEDKDTLALMPTGGGKSICFQIPALMRDGICIVISPLIALMKDQVENLKKRGIKAVAVYSGINKREIDIAFDNCIYGNYKFLYLSPERLDFKQTQKKIESMKVNLLTVDEAHCISQWGYDFRPSYLNIVEIRKVIPNVPALALTATATSEVAKDIQIKLQFKQENLLKTGFERKNLTYFILYEEDKLKRLLRIVQKLKGSGIIYVRSRIKAKFISEFLRKNRINADYYHAGLDILERNNKQDAWIKEQTRIIVATNAFGMGINKTNVRFVVHFDLADSLEEYFQEAGRAGRDDNTAYAILIYNEGDKIDIEQRKKTKFPTIDEIKRTYQALGNYFQIAVGAGQGVAFDFNIQEFCSTYKLPILITFNSIKILEKEGLISATEAVYEPSRVHFEVDKDTLYDFQLRNKDLDPYIKLLLRTYAGVFDDFIKINEKFLANKIETSEETITTVLKKLHNSGILTYIPQNNSPKIVFTQPRMDIKYLTISPENLQERQKDYEQRVNAVLQYAETMTKCRSQILLSYFGEKDSNRCGKCDVCLERNKLELSKYKFDLILEQIKELLKIEKIPMTLDEVVDNIEKFDKNDVIKVVQWVLDNQKIYYDNENKLRWKE